MAFTDDQRQQLCQRCRNKKQRKTLFTRDRPTVWNPHTVTNPATGLPFTDYGAWDLIAQMLESGHDFSEVSLKRPPGAKAYEAWKRFGDGTVIYIKIEPLGALIYGRSFHYDTPVV